MAIIVFNVRRQHAESGNHRGKEKDSETKYYRESNLGDELVFGKVFAQCDEGGEMR